VLAALLCLGLAGSITDKGSAAATAGKPGVFTGYGFESCNAPSIEALTAWLASPYRAVGIYIGGANRTCANAHLTPAWVDAALAGGWSLIPTYVGLQAPCVTDPRRGARFTAANAGSQGTAAADDAIARATLIGLPPGSPLYFDMEAYSVSNPACTAAVQTFVAAYATRLHSRGYASGVYGSAASTARDMQALAGTAGAPQNLWIANWNGKESVFGDPYVSDALWTSHQRIKQYRGGHAETWGGVTISIDNDYVDATLVTPSGTVPPPAVPGTDEGGTVSTADGQATASWTAGALGDDADLTLEPIVPGPTLPGYATGGYGVQLAAQSLVTLKPVRAFAEPLTLTFTARRNRLAPVYSTNGLVWKRVPVLAGESIGAGARTGYARDGGGGFVIRTTVVGTFALVPDRIRPSAPADVSARFLRGELALAWARSSDGDGPVAGYRVTLTNRPLAELPRSLRRHRLAGFHRNRPSVYRVVAVDPAGNESRPSKPVVVLPRARPSKLPKAIPRWAWALLDWQAARDGPRPDAPKAVPEWYWRWAEWQSLPFRLR
jgi:hypothetical protein